MIISNILLGPGGWYIEWFDEETEMVAYWYGTHAECKERAKGPTPDVWNKLTEGAGPYDEATATGMYD